VIIERLLARGGHEVTLVEKWRRGRLKRCATGVFDLVLMDMRIAVMDGWWKPPGPSAGSTGPKRLYSRHRPDANATRKTRALLAAGMDDHLIKPVDRPL